jgi:hypothetical protein
VPERPVRRALAQLDADDRADVLALLAIETAERSQTVA